MDIFKHASFALLVGPPVIGKEMVKNVFFLYFPKVYFLKVCSTKVYFYNIYFSKVYLTKVYLSVFLGNVPDLCVFHCVGFASFVFLKTLFILLEIHFVTSGDRNGTCSSGGRDLGQP